MTDSENYDLLGINNSKGRIFRYRDAGAKGERIHNSLSLFISALDGVSVQHHAPVAIYPGERAPGSQ
jgi:hypothetical protein